VGFFFFFFLSFLLLQPSARWFGGGLGYGSLCIYVHGSVHNTMVMDDGWMDECLWIDGIIHRKRTLHAKRLTQIKKRD
jgi:hypothetical protein